MLSPNRSGKPKTNVGWAYCASTSSQDLVLLYFERDCPRAVLSGLRAEGRYRMQWFNPRTGEWLAPSEDGIPADREGNLQLPPFPTGETKSQEDWAMKVMPVQGMPEKSVPRAE